MRVITNVLQRILDLLRTPPPRRAPVPVRVDDRITRIAGPRIF